MKIIKIVFIFQFLLLAIVAQLRAQTTEPVDRWDNWFLVGNKIVFGGVGDFKHSHEIQFRVKNNMQSLDQWFYEGVFTYSLNNHWEIVPDFRAAIKPTAYDFRPALGVVRKDYIGKGENKYNIQFVQQFKFQVDMDSEGNNRSGLRYVLTYNNVVNDHLVISGLTGAFYRWSEGFNGIEFVRAGPIFTYIFDKVHSVSFAPLFGAGNLGVDGWAYSFTPMVQLIIRTNKQYKYLPAKYINF
jgi:hypothetical protein